MNTAKQEVIQQLSQLLGEESIITNLQALREHDSDDRAFAKAFDLYEVPLPICIANVTSKEQISAVLRWCSDAGVAVIPKTGGSSYEGLLSAASENTIILDASSMNQILNIDTYNMMVTCQCGVPLQTLEDTLNKQGFTTGHSPQSLPVAQMGGLVGFPCDWDNGFFLQCVSVSGKRGNLSAVHGKIPPLLFLKEYHDSL